MRAIASSAMNRHFDAPGVNGHFPSAAGRRAYTNLLVALAPERVVLPGTVALPVGTIPPRHATSVTTSPRGPEAGGVQLRVTSVLGTG
jgi:hypothetical protein